MKRLFALCIAMSLVACFAARGGEKNVTLKVANVPSQSAIEAAAFLKEMVERESGGSMKVNVFDNNALGDDRIVVEGAIFGEIDIAVSSTSPLATMYADFYMFDAPYLFLTTDEVYAAFDGEVGKKILDGMAEIGLKGLTLWENGFRNFTNNKVAVRLPQDVAGMKIRTMENEIHLAAWKALGANPTPMAFTELFTALQQGTVDGEENPLGIIDQNKFQEVQKYLSMTQHVYTPYLVCMNLDKYNSLSPNQREILDKAVAESTKFQRRRSQELEGEIKTRFAKTGVVTDITPEEKKAWQDVVVKANILDLAKKKMKHPEYIDMVLGK